MQKFESDGDQDQIDDADVELDIYIEIYNLVRQVEEYERISNNVRQKNFKQFQNVDWPIELNQIITYEDYYLILLFTKAAAYQFDIVKGNLEDWDELLCIDVLEKLVDVATDCPNEFIGKGLHYVETIGVCGLSLVEAYDIDLTRKYSNEELIEFYKLSSFHQN
jgi:hypothetical protein